MQRTVFAELQLQPNENFNESDSAFLRCDANSCYYEYPLKILLPDSTSSSCCQWIYPVIFGGGLVEGDEINISIKVKSRCCALLASLSFPKVYCCENGLNSQQHMVFEVCSDALLCVLPDPVVCYRKSSYIQTQTYYLTPDSNLVALDWFTSGRYESGERWDFTRLKSSSLFLMNKQLIFKESQCLQNTSHLSVKKSMKFYNVCGTCIIMGPYLSFLFKNILLELGKSLGYGQKHEADLLFAVSSLTLDDKIEPVGCIIRFTAVSVGQVIQRLGELLEPIFAIIGGNPLNK